MGWMPASAMGERNGDKEVSRQFSWNRRGYLWNLLLARGLEIQISQRHGRDRTRVQRGLHSAEMGKVNGTPPVLSDLHGPPGSDWETTPGTGGESMSTVYVGTS